MVSEISLAVIALSLVVLVVLFLLAAFKAKECFDLFQSELQKISTELVRADLSKVSDEASNLLSNLSDLTSDVNKKSQSLNCLFKPLSFLSSKITPDSSQEEPRSKTIPQVLKWFAISALLIKSTKEFIKNYGKS